MSDTKARKTTTRKRATKKASKTRVPAQRLEPETSPDGVIDCGYRGQKRMAYRWAKRFTGRFLYAPGRGWLEWVGSHWKPCTDAGPWRAVNEVCQDALRDLIDLPPGQARDDLYKDVRLCDSEFGTKGVLAHVMRAKGIQCDDDALDSQSHLFAFRNGTFDLDEGRFRESRPDDLITLVSDIDYDPDAECPMYDELMDLYQPDEAIQDYLHRLAGAAMEGKQNLQHLVTWYGATGGNGKGTITRAWQHVFGSYAKVFPVEGLLSRKGSSAEAYRDQKAQLKGVRLVFATEPTEGARFDTGTVKALTGNDTITARAMHKAAVTFDPTWLIIMSTNTRVSTPNDGGMARRLKEVKWGFKVKPDQMRNDLDDILKKEAAGIANRIILGWFQYRLNGIQHPVAVEESTKEYLASVDQYGRFLDECTEVVPGSFTGAMPLYNRYRQWCEDGGEYPKSNRLFGEEMGKKLAELGLEKKRKTIGWVWLDLTTH